MSGLIPQRRTELRVNTGYAQGSIQLVADKDTNLYYIFP